MLTQTEYHVLCRFNGVLNVHVGCTVIRERIFMSANTTRRFHRAIQSALDSHTSPQYKWLATVSAVTSAPVSIVGVARPL